MAIKGKGKGKEVTGKAPAGKRKRGFDDDKTGGGRKRSNRGVLQFFDDAADVDENDDSDDSDFSDDYFEDEFETLSTMMNESAKGQSSLPFIPKEELVDEEEFDRMMEERYGEGSKFVTFAGDEFDDKPIEPNSLHPGVKEPIPTIWKVKCTVGRERLSAFCLMQKFADLKSLGTKLQIISAFAVDHMKGFVYIEAEKQCDINEACQGISGIYVTRVQPVPKSEIFHLFSVRSRKPEISEGMWARIKSGNYKGDLAQVVAVNNTTKKVTVKLVPRIDLQALAAKFGGGYSRQKTAVPAPRLISSSELEEFRPLIQIRRDRDTGKVFEVLDGLLLKDGYIYKKVSPDSLSLWGVVPTEEELLKFGPSESNESNDMEWLSQVYGDSKKKRVIRGDKGGGKGESSSGSGVLNGFELYDLVCFGKKDFGVIIGMDKDDSYKILKESSEGSVAVTVVRHEIKSGLFDLKLSAQDQHNKTILVNDNVGVLEGPLKGKQGIVKHIYRGIVFLHDENEEENGGYFTAKANMCEKVKLAVGDFSGKDSEPGPLVFDDQPSSPRSPLSPKKPWQAREHNREFNRGDSDSLFTIGQTLRIRIGPLKGYLCRVTALHRSDVTVKLDSQGKVLKVKCEHLSEVQGKNTSMSTSGDPESSSLKPFDLLGAEGSSGGWMDGAGTSTGGGGWNAGGTSAERSAWSNHSAPSFLKPESTSNPFGSEEDTAWETKNTSTQKTSWGAAVENNGIASDPDQSDGWGKSGGSWGQAEHKIGSTSDDNQNSKQKNKTNDLDGSESAGWDSKSNWNTTKASEDESSGWNSVKTSNESSATGWGQGNGFKSGSNDGGNSNPTWKSGTSGAKEFGKPAGTSDFDDNQDAGWKNKPNKDGNKPSSWERNNNWNAPISSSQVKCGWNEKSTKDDKEEKGNDQGGWSAGKASDGSTTGLGQASGWKSGLSEGAKEGANWGKAGSSTVAENEDWNSVSGYAGGSQGQASNLGTWKSGSSTENENQNSNWSSGHTDPGNQDSNWGKKSNGNSGNNGKQESDPNNGNWNSGSGGSNQTSSWGKNGSWNSNNSSGSDRNENKNSNWSSGHTDPGNQDSNWGKKSNWNSANSGNTNSDPNNSNWNSGSGDSNQASKWGKNGNWNSGNSEKEDSNPNNSNWNSGSGGSNQNSNWGSNGNWNSNKSSWSAGNENKNSNWSSGNADPQTQDSNWGKKSNWNSGSGGASQNTNWRSDGNWNSGNASSGDKLGGVNEGLNETSDDGGGGNWRGGYRGRGGFRGRGFQGRGERGGFGGRGERGGFSGRGERGGFGGRGRSDREGFGGRWGSDRGFGGRGRGRNDQPGGWKNRQDPGEDGSSDWKKGLDNVEGWKSNNGSGAWNKSSSDKKDGQSWSQQNADKDGPSWNQGGGSNKQWQSGSSAGGGASDSWNSNGPKQTGEAKDGAGWKKSTAIEETNIQEGGWNKRSNSNTPSRGWDNQEVGWKGSAASGNGSQWGQSNAADKGQSSGWNESTDGSWGKRNDGSDKGGW